MIMFSNAPFRRNSAFAKIIGATQVMLLEVLKDIIDTMQIAILFRHFMAVQKFIHTSTEHVPIEFKPFLNNKTLYQSILGIAACAIWFTILGFYIAMLYLTFGRLARLEAYAYMHFRPYDVLNSLAPEEQARLVRIICPNLQVEVRVNNRQTDEGYSED